MLNSHGTLLRRLIDRAILYFSFHETIDGLRVSVFVDRKVSARTLSNVREALDLIRRHDPYRYRRVVTRLNHVLVNPTPNQGEYYRELRRCVLGQKTVEAGDIATIAATLVHESTHAELHDRGIGYDPAIRARVEGICSRQELAFASRLADNADLIDVTEQRLAMPEETWSSEAMWQRKIEWLEQESDAPKWLIRAGLAFRNWRLRRAGAMTGVKSGTS